MPWTSITTAAVQKKLTAAEYASITAAQLPDGVTGTQVVEAEISNAITEVRGYVAGNAENVLGLTGTVPDELLDTTLVIIRHRVFTRLPGMKMLLDELRQQELKDAMARLRDVAAGRFRLVQPTDPAAADLQAGGGMIEVVKKTPRRVTRENMSGLI